MEEELSAVVVVVTNKVISKKSGTGTGVVIVKVIDVVDRAISNLEETIVIFDELDDELDRQVSDSKGKDVVVDVEEFEAATAVAILVVDKVSSVEVKDVVVFTRNVFQRCGCLREIGAVELDDTLDSSGRLLLYTRDLLVVLTCCFRHGCIGWCGDVDGFIINLDSNMVDLFSPLSISSLSA